MSFNDNWNVFGKNPTMLTYLWNEVVKTEEWLALGEWGCYLKIDRNVAPEGSKWLIKKKHSYFDQNYLEDMPNDKWN